MNGSVFLVNYALRVFGEIGFFHDNESIQVPTYFKHKTLKDIKSGGIISSIINFITLKDIRKNSNHDNVPFTEQFNNFISKNHLYSSIIGINWKDKPSTYPQKLPQKQNNFHYFYPEQIPSKFFKFKSMLTKSEFTIESDYKSARYSTNHGTDRLNEINNILFLFINMDGFYKYTITKKPRIKLSYKNSNLYGIIEHINTQLDHKKKPMINENYINYSILYNIAKQILQTNIMITPLMMQIFINILNRNEEQIIFWNSLKYKHNMIDKSK